MSWEEVAGTSCWYVLEGLGDMEPDTSRPEGDLLTAKIKEYF